MAVLVRLFNLTQQPREVRTFCLVLYYTGCRCAVLSTKGGSLIWSRMTAYRKVKGVMEVACLDGVKATPKGLRHAFGVACNQKGVQTRRYRLMIIHLNMAQKWLGHADIRTTAIYSDAVGQEERNVAQRLWEDE